MAGDHWFAKINKRFRETGTGTNAGVSVDHAAVEARKHMALHISGSGDAAAVVTVESPAGTILWRRRYAGAFNFSETFPPGTIIGATNSVLRLKISASTANCEANLIGGEMNG